MKPPHSSVCASLRIAAPLIVISVCMTSLAGCGGGSSGGNGDSSGADNAHASIPGFTAIASGGVSTPAFHVHKNAHPIATVDEELLILNTDQRAGIPIPYTVSDEESDEVQVVFQWKRSSEDFPPLPDTPGAIHAILADPEQRAEKHICTEYPTWVEGSVVPIDADSVRLPELATSAASILAHGLVGRELEIMREHQVPQPIVPTWASNPLNHPVAALPLGDGIEALVLDRASLGGWRLRQIDLATGVVTRNLVPLAAGQPTAMTLERGEESVLVASHIAGAWRLRRITLADGAITPLIAFDGSTESGPIRGLASQGSSSALATVASSLIRLEFSDALPARSATIFDDLSTPWGVAIDPLNTNRVYLAERDADTVYGTGQILSIRLDTLERRPIVADPVDVLGGVFDYPFPLPRALALDRSGSRLLAITQGKPSDATWELRAIDLGGANANHPIQLLWELPAPADSIVTGADDLLVLALAAEQDLYVSGGLEQRRTIAELELAHHTVRVSESFAPALTVAPRFRVRNPSLVVRPSPSGTRGSFVWDSADVPDGAPVNFRAVPMDANVGVEGSTEAAKLIRSALDTEPVAVGNWIVTTGARSVVAADLDGDGDLDLASAHPESDTLTVFFQTSPGVLGNAPLSLGNSGVTDLPLAVTAADFDGDGDSDLASANAESDTLTIFFQQSPGVFGSTPLTLGNASVTDYPYSVTSADFDGDGDLDLASANAFGHTLTVFFQESPGVFGSMPLSLGGIGVTTRPVCVVGADLDGDGDLDIASANWRSHTLTVFFQTSPGVFGSTPLSLGDPSVTSYPSSVIAADLDGDGDLDLASANDGSQALTVFFQESPGVFGVTPLSLGAQSETFDPLSVTAADLDGDGDLDLASANYSSHTITVFFQETPGVFSATPLALGNTNTSGTFFSPTSVIAADLDGDGRLDLASANEEGDTLSVYFQSSPGVFGSTPLSLGASDTPKPHDCIVAADLDGDGDLDLVSASDGYEFLELDANTLNVFFQESPGVFRPSPLTLGNANVTWGACEVAAADLDGDGDLDLASANWRSDTLAIFFQTGPGVFGSTPLSLGTPAQWPNGQWPTDAPNSVVAADIDGDGDLDLASANDFGNRLKIFFQTSPGVFGSTPLSLGNASVTNGPRYVAAADLDGDGDLDLVSANARGDTLAVFFQTSPGVFGSNPLSLGNAAVTNFPRYVAAADLDGDGDLDLASANMESDTLTVFFQVSPGVFGSTPLKLGNASVTNSPYSVTAADFDGDGDLDLASANGSSHTLTVFFQTSPGVFGPTPLSLGDSILTDTPLAVAAADLDGDGDLDLLSGNHYGRTISVFWNNH